MYQLLSRISHKFISKHRCTFLASKAWFHQPIAHLFTIALLVESSELNVRWWILERELAKVEVKHLIAEHCCRGKVWLVGTEKQVHTSRQLDPSSVEVKSKLLSGNIDQTANHIAFFSLFWHVCDKVWTIVPDLLYPEANRILLIAKHVILAELVTLAAPSNAKWLVLGKDNCLVEKYTRLDQIMRLCCGKLRATTAHCQVITSVQERSYFRSFFCQKIHIL